MSGYGRIRAGVGRVFNGAGIIAGGVTFIMMVLVVANALLRFAVNMPINGTLEITESSLTILIFLSLALTQYEGGHIHVVLVTRNFPPFLRRAVAFLAMGLGFVFFAWASVAAWEFAMKSLAIGEQQWGAIQYPLYPVKFVIFGGLVALAGQFAIDALGVALGEDVPGAATDAAPEEME
jgi:TRAP-type C4-dicarboxylate transport system permease small subunit